MRFPRFFALFLLAPLIPLGAINISSNATYTQNFDTLASSGVSNTWTNDSTIPGWYAQANGTFGGTYTGNFGNSSAGDLYSYGGNLSSERALGVLNSSGTGNIAYGVSFTNTGNATIQFESIGYTGEVWRAGAANQTLTFSYQLAFGSITDLTPISEAAWTQVPGLTFTAPASGVGIAVDGNLSGNRTLVSFDLKAASQMVFLQANQTVMFRWLDIDFQGGTEAGLAIDDLSILYTVVPEPHSAALLIAGGLLGLRRSRRRTA